MVFWYQNTFMKILNLYKNSILLQNFYNNIVFSQQNSFKYHLQTMKMSCIDVECLNLKTNLKQQTIDVFNDPLGQTHSGENYFHLKFILFCEILKSGDGRTDDMCEIVITTVRPRGSTKSW